LQTGAILKMVISSNTLDDISLMSYMTFSWAVIIKQQI